jgi:hypothetical protein
MDVNVVTSLVVFIETFFVNVFDTFPFPLLNLGFRHFIISRRDFYKGEEL